MTANNTWPYPARPGVPLNPEQDGWHWLQDSEGNKECVSWRERKFLGNGRGLWSFVGYENDFQPHEIRDWTYLGPVLTPDEAAALQKRVAELETALKAAAEDIGDWGVYASQYLQEKWDLSGEVKRYTAIAEGKLPYRARYSMEEPKNE